MMKKVSGLPNNLKEFQDFSSELNSYASSLSFNKNDRRSVEIAINNLNEKIDQYAYRYPNNKIIREMAIDLKKIYKKAFYEKSGIKVGCE